MAVKSAILVLLASTVVVVSSTGLLETLLSWELPDAEARSTTPQSKCLCQTSGCLCCVEMNLTATIDLGGPACLNIKQKEQNVSLNLSYGDNPVHNATIKIADAANKPTCMNLLSDLAQICARFTSVRQGETGYDGCLVVEPALLGTAQAAYHVGCFNFNQGVRQVEVSAITETTNPEENPEEEEDDGINTDELIAAVSASAEHGIALFSQWLGLSLNPKLNLTRNDNKQKHEEQHTEARSIGRSARYMIDDQTEKNDERFKRLLSAQDNIQKGSATIGLSNGAETTFVYSQPADLVSEKNFDFREKTVETENMRGSQQRLTIPRESRRGGRAYNIHQHVNEI